MRLYDNLFTLLREILFADKFGESFAHCCFVLADKLNSCDSQRRLRVIDDLQIK